MPKRKSLDTWAQLLAELRRTGRRLEDVPASVVRAALKKDIPGTRSILLPPPLIRSALREPLLRDLLVTRIGYSGPGVGFIPRPEGSLDHILLYTVAGKGWCQIAGKRWELPAETAAFLRRGVPHSYGTGPKDPYSIYWIHFTGRQAEEFFAALQVSEQQPLLHLPCTEEVLSAIELIYGYMAAVHTPSNLLAASTALARLLGLIQLRREQPQETGVDQTIAFMQHNLSRRVTLRELAHLAHLSVSGYEQAFTKRTGCPPITYFNRMKVQKACRQLLETDLPAKEIATALGFDDPYHFSRLFKKHTGLSPANFRQHRPVTQAAVESSGRPTPRGSRGSVRASADRERSR
jgi:AraC family transcriptional regulator, arabinose operon regulatory protein